jgi:hypothetical protein
MDNVKELGKASLKEHKWSLVNMACLETLVAWPLPRVRQTSLVHEMLGYICDNILHTAQKADFVACNCLHGNDSTPCLF